MSEEKILNLNRENVESSGEKEERVSIIDFMAQYNEATSTTEKDALIQSICYGDNYYVPFLTKKMVIITLLNQSSVQEENSVMYLDTTLMKINMFAMLLSLYTKLDVKAYTKQHSTFELYDWFQSHQLYNIIINNINSCEFQEIMGLQEELTKIWHQKNTSVEAYIQRNIHNIIKWIQLNEESIQAIMEQISDQ